MRKVTLQIHIDALRHDYITEPDMPFLHGLASRGVQATLVPPFGFEPDGAYLTGTHPESYGGGAHFVWAQGHNPIPFARRLPGWLDLLSAYGQYPVRRLVERGIALRGTTRRIRLAPRTAHIPLGLLRHFDYCHYQFPYEPGFAGRAKTVFDYLRDAGDRSSITATPSLTPPFSVPSTGYGIAFVEPTSRSS